MEFDSGTTAEFCCSVQFESTSRLEVYGTDGFAIGDNTMTIHGGGRIRTDEGELEFERADPYRGEIEDFADAVRDGRPPEVDGHEGLRNVELLSQIA